MSREMSWISAAPFIIRSKKGTMIRREPANNAAKCEPQAETCTMETKSKVHNSSWQSQRQTCNEFVKETPVIVAGKDDDAVNRRLRF